MSVPFGTISYGALPGLPINRHARRVLGRRQPARLRALQAAARRLALDPMEQRILLSADVLAIDLASLSPEQRDFELLLRMVDEAASAEASGASVRRIEIVDLSGDRVLAFGDASTITQVSIVGGAGADRLTVDALSFDGATPLIAFDGRGGMDHLVFETADDVVWTVLADNEGHATDGRVTVNFTSVETLEGAADNDDTFVLVDNAFLDGGVIGGDRGFDTLVMDGERIEC